MTDSDLKFFIKLAKSLKLGFNATLSISEINNCLRQAIDNPNLIIPIKFENKKFHRESRAYDLLFVITKCILFYNREIDFDIRLKFLESLLFKKNFYTLISRDKQTNIKYWIRILFSDFDNYVNTNYTLEELIYPFTGNQINNKQIRVSRLVVEQFNKNFRTINSGSRRILLEKLMENKALHKSLQKLVLKHSAFISKYQLTFFYENLCDNVYKDKLLLLIQTK